jgi:hypothetical protein
VLPRLDRFSTWSCGALLLAAGCGTDIAQTAALEPSGRLDCSTTAALLLPSDAVFGDGSEPPSHWLGEGYAAEQGPGLYVAARDAYRVYLNGELVVQSSAARRSRSIESTRAECRRILTGSSVLSLLVHAADLRPRS